MFKRVLCVLLASILLASSISIATSADVGDYTMNEVESNNSYSLADRIYNDYTVTGKVSGTDLDFYKFVLSSRSTISVVCVADYSMLTFGVFDSTGDDCLKAATATTTSDGTPGDTLVYTLNAGTYNLVFLNNTQVSYTNNYMFYFTYTAAASHTHSYSESVTAPTCTAQGYTTYACTCGDSYVGSYVAAKGHTAGDWFVNDAPTCTTEGTKTKYCSVCGVPMETESMQPAHQYTEWVVTRYPTTTATGEKKRSCTACVNGDEVEEIPTVGWHGNQYMDWSGDYVRNTWMKIGGYWYNFNAEGYLYTNCWRSDAAGWVYLGSNGRMVTNAWMADSKGWCYLGADGYCVTNCWKRDSNGWVYLGSDGRMATNAWQKDSKGWCYLGTDGYMVKNCWKADSNGWVYLGSDGRMVTNAWQKDSAGWCYLGTNGYCVTNTWKKDSKGWVYLNGSGRMAVNSWAKDGAYWCYLGADGYMKTGWVQDDGYWYFLDGSGHMATGWKADSKGWVYLDASGRMVTNSWRKDGSYWCYLGSNGYMKTGWVKDGGDWYYTDGSGHMVTGWKTIGGKEYYFYGSGIMATSTYVSGYWVGTDGAWIPNYDPASKVYNKLIYSDSVVDIYLLKMNSEGIVFEAKNKTGFNILIQADTLAVNGRSTEDIIMSDEVAPYSISTIEADCAITGVYTVGIISGQFRIINDDNWSDNYDATFVDVIVDGSVSDTKPAVNQPLLYEDTNVKIYYKGTNNEGVVFTVENKTNVVVTIQANTVTLNGRSTDDIIMSDDVAPHSVGDVVADCDLGAQTSYVSTIGASLRVIDFNNGFDHYNVNISSCYV